MASYVASSPIHKIGTTTEFTTYSYVAVPSGYTFNLSDVSDSNAGRTEDTMMHKNMLGSCVHLGLEWSYITPAQAQEIMTAFAPEYFAVEFLDVRTGTYSSKYFYAGDKSATMTQTPMGVRYTLSFNIIQRTAQ
jgi:hypothetical protein